MCKDVVYLKYGLERKFPWQQTLDINTQTKGLEVTRTEDIR